MSRDKRYGLREHEFKVEHLVLNKPLDVLPVLDSFLPHGYYLNIVLEAEEGTFSYRCSPSYPFIYSLPQIDPTRNISKPNCVSILSNAIDATFARLAHIMSLRQFSHYVSHYVSLTSRKMSKDEYEDLKSLDSLLDSVLTHVGGEQNMQSGDLEHTLWHNYTYHFTIADADANIRAVSGRIPQKMTSDQTKDTTLKLCRILVYSLQFFVLEEASARLCKIYGPHFRKRGQPGYKVYAAIADMSEIVFPPCL